MSDKNVDLGATDLFGLGGSFHAQSSSTDPFSTEDVALSSIGDVSCSNVHNSGTDYSASYRYCGTNMVGGLGAILTGFGAVNNGILVTGIDVTFSVGAQPEISITGHNHTTNPHAGTNAANSFDVSGAFSGGSLGVVTVGTQANTNAEATGSSFSFSLNHIDVESTTGHWVGESITARCDASVDYVGVASVTAAAWDQLLTATSDGNEEIDTSSVTAHKFFAAT
tara:strand:- start:58 stop:729 length:672 start_codon:yes stop_codon:yes gene_type:complete